MKSVLLFSILLVVGTNFKVNAKFNDENEAWKAWYAIAAQYFSAPATQTKLATVFSAALLERIQVRGQEYQEPSNDVKLDICITPILTNISDPLPLDPLTLSVPASSGYSGIIKGNFHSCDTSITGLSTIKDCVKFVDLPAQPISIRLGYAIQTHTVTLKGIHSTAMELILGLLRVTGFGSYGFEVSNFFLDIDFTLYATTTLGLKIKDVKLDLGFDEIIISSDESNLNGIVIDWTSVSKDIKEIFDVLWPFIKPIADPLLGTVLSGIIKDCGLIHLVPGLPTFLQCLNPGLLANSIQDAGLFELPVVEPMAEGACIAHYTLPPIIPPPEHITLPPFSGAAGGLMPSYLAIVGVVVVFFVNIHRRA